MVKAKRRNKLKTKARNDNLFCLVRHCRTWNDSVLFIFFFFFRLSLNINLIHSWNWFFFYLKFGTAVAAWIGGGTLYGNGNFAATAGFSNNIFGLFFYFFWLSKNNKKKTIFSFFFFLLSYCFKLIAVSFRFTSLFARYTHDICSLLVIFILVQLINWTSYTHTLKILMSISYYDEDE